MEADVKGQVDIRGPSSVSLVMICCNNWRSEQHLPFEAPPLVAVAAYIYTPELDGLEDNEPLFGGPL